MTLSELEKVESLATPGPWDSKDIDNYTGLLKPVARLSFHTDEMIDESKRNTNFIAALRNHATQLFESARKAERLTEELKRIKYLIERQTINAIEIEGILRRALE